MYKILARKYRPERFSDVLEQEHVTVTLMRAIKTGKVGQAYLFSGPRGVGKTTVARVLVKTLNCENLSEDRTQCCGDCSFCVDITKGVSLDYQEIDGASHRGIDQIREIKTNLPYASANNKYRVFVIDEAHMLTPEAFNAMLKSLEEPPQKVIFILCTTESGKIPLTIRSRCQHFRFKLVSRHNLEQMLTTVANQENITADADALFYIAKHAGGSIRDAQNLLEQVAAYAGGAITREKTLTALGEVSKEVLYEFMVNLEAGDLKANYELVETLTEQGGSFATFLYECVALLSSFTYLQEGLKDSKLFHLSTEDMKQFYELCHRFKRDEIYKLLDCLFEFIQEFKNTTEERTLRDLALIKLHRYKKLISNEEIRESLVLLAQASDLVEDAVPTATPSATEVNSASAKVQQSYPNPNPSPNSNRGAASPAAVRSMEPASNPHEEKRSPGEAAPKSMPSQSPPPVEPQPVAPTHSEIQQPSKAPNHKDTTSAAAASQSHVTLNSPTRRSSAPVAKQNLVITTWDEEAYRSLMTLASRTGHAIFEYFKQMSFQRYTHNKLVLMLGSDIASSTALTNFEKVFVDYLRELMASERLQLKTPMPELELIPNALVEQTEKIANVFKQARIVGEE